MNDFKNSQFKMATVGLVAADKPLNSKFIEVYPMELLPFYEGKITDDLVGMDKTGLDSDGVQYTVKLKKGMSIKAEWIGSSNRRTSPNVKKNEQVRLWTIGDSEKYWWEPLGRDDKLRTKERVTWAWAARSIANGELTANNTYSFTVDTIDQHITVQTSNVNGEKAKFTIQANGREGHVTVADNLDNTIQMDSVNKKIILVNGDKTYLSVDKKDLIAYAPENCKFTFEGNYTLNVGKDYDVYVGGELKSSVEGDITDWCGGGRITQVGGIHSMESGSLILDTIGLTSIVTGSLMMFSQGVFKIESPELIMQSAEPIIFSTPMVNINGALTVTGSTVVLGNVSINGTTLLAGNTTVSGAFSVAGVSTFAGLATFAAGIVTPTINGIVPGSSDGTLL